MGKYISLVNKEGYEYVTRNIGKEGAVVIIASKYADERTSFQLILSTRPTFDKPILEFPAGLLDVEGESIVDAAKRELQEETGWNSTDVVLNNYGNLPVPSSAGLTDEVLYLINLRIPSGIKRGQTAHSGGEKIKVLPLMNMMQLHVFITKFKDQMYVSSRVLAFFMGNMYNCGSEVPHVSSISWLDNIESMNDIPNTEDGI